MQKDRLRTLKLVKIKDTKMSQQKQMSKNNQEPTRECCDYCRYADKCENCPCHKENFGEKLEKIKHIGFFVDGELTCSGECPHPCHSIKPPVEDKCYSCGGKGYYTQMYGEVGSDDFGGEGYEIDPTIHKKSCSACNGTGNKPNQEEKCKGLNCKQHYGEEHFPPKLSPEVGDFRWKDTKEKVKGEVLAKDYENWLEKNAHNLECWTGEEWKSLVSPELSWEQQIKKGLCELCDNDEEHEIKNCGVENKGLNIHWVIAFIKKVEQQAVQQYAKEMFYKMKDFEKVHFNSGRASMVEIIKGLKKKVIANMLQEDEVFQERGMDGVKGYNQALDDILQVLKNKETKE